jgi:uncharacterized protein with ParB-like and HNH nuclease domain
VSFTNSSNQQEIIDGQQRITSLFLLLRAIYTKLSLPVEKTAEAKNFINEKEPTLWRKDKLPGEVNFSDTLLTSLVVNNADGNEILHQILATGKTHLKALLETDILQKSKANMINLISP